MEWKVHGHQRIYASEWVNLEIADVELPDGQRLAHHVLRPPRTSVVVAMVDAAERVLMLWRHRFITDRWGWELPAGWVEPGEDPATAASREALEETVGAPDRCGCCAPSALITGSATPSFVSTAPIEPLTRVGPQTGRRPAGSSGCRSRRCAG
jgi:hypothetical protein